MTGPLASLGNHLPTLPFFIPFSHLEVKRGDNGHTESLPSLYELYIRAVRERERGPLKREAMTKCRPLSLIYIQLPFTTHIGRAESMAKCRPLFFPLLYKPLRKAAMTKCRPPFLSLWYAASIYNRYREGSYDNMHASLSLLYIQLLCTTHRRETASRQ